MKSVVTLYLVLSTAQCFTIGPNYAPSSSRTKSLHVVEQLASFDTTTIAEAGVAVITAAGVATFMNQNGESSSSSTTSATAEPEVEKIDVSIPYDSAAILAYEEWREGEFDQEVFAAYKKIYKGMAITKVTFKKQERDAADAMAKYEKELNALKPPLKED
eukprot:CAMPEP_0195314886 /NCGR_PEP_ID=MMETSP0708-20121125/2671_1 /TAXON_ID=33640 /ORGANISM="Asterionellopsis glacialis, Strain CCMP134" /LENGTH=159 /DNA_ID=CAMNT_0040379983 /DNA_START=1 /DNA_END=480 /DNA_ORIENTATION=+